MPEVVGDDWQMAYETGYKDDYLVVVRFDEPRETWAPRNPAIFALVDLWLTAEEEWFGDGFGKRMPWFYLGLCYLNRVDGAMAATGLEGRTALDHFARHVDHFAPRLRADLRGLEQGVTPYV